MSTDAALWLLCHKETANKRALDDPGVGEACNLHGSEVTIDVWSGNGMRVRRAIALLGAVQLPPGLSKPLVPERISRDEVADIGDPSARAQELKYRSVGPKEISIWKVMGGSRCGHEIKAFRFANLVQIGH